MAEPAEIATAIACLSTVYPQFVAKELASLADGIATAIQGFTDPLAAIGDIKIDSVIKDVETLSEGDVFENLSEAAVGLTFQYVKRDAEEMLADIAAEYASPTKRVQEIRNLSNSLVSAAYTGMSLYNDMPYAAAQRMCETIIGVAEMKIQNLRCLKKHVVQLINSVLVLLENDDYRDNTLNNLASANNLLVDASVELDASQSIRDGVTVFDQEAFTRAREDMNAARSLLTPDKDGTSILDATDILTSGSVAAGQINRSNQALVHIAIPSLIKLVTLEAEGVVSQVGVVNFHVGQLAKIIDSYRKAGTTSRVRTERSRAINTIKAKLTEVISRIELALDRGSITQASAEMLSWSSKVKAMIAIMDNVNVLSLQEGSIEGEDKAILLETDFQNLLTNLASISATFTADGIEDPTAFRDKIFALASYAERIVADVELGKMDKATLQTFHQLAIQTGTSQVSLADESISVALQQKNYCQQFADIDLAVKSRYDDLIDTMRQVGMDRGVDLLGTGQFSEFLELDIDELSYLGSGIGCLTDALDGIDDAQTRQQIAAIRDDMVAQKVNEDVAAADSADQGRTRFITKLQVKIAEIQRNAKTVESIVGTLEEILKKTGASLQDAGLSLSPFVANIDHLSVGAGGRLSSNLEEYSDHANGGVPLCD